MESLTLETFAGLVNAGVTGVFLYMFISGKIVSKPVMDKILEEAENRTTKIVDELALKIKEAVKLGMIEANQEINGKKNKSS